MRTSAAATAGTLPTLRFEYTTCCLNYPTTLIANTPLGTLTVASDTGAVVLIVPNAPGGVYSLTLREETGWFSDITQEARERIFLDTILVRSYTYLSHGGPGYVYWNPPSYETPVAIKITLDSTELAPLGDSDNKRNPDRGETSRPKVVDLSKAKSTPMSVTVSYWDGTPVRYCRLRLSALGKDSTG